MRIGPLGIWELLIILVVVLLIFGPRRLPEMAKGLGQSVREFRKGIRDIRSDFEEGEKADSDGGSRERASAGSSATGAASAGSAASAQESGPAPASEQAADTERTAEAETESVPSDERDETKKVASDV
jgi:sec-independent protein translocase protein TatA